MFPGYNSDNSTLALGPNTFHKSTGLQADIDNVNDKVKKRLALRGRKVGVRGCLWWAHICLRLPMCSNCFDFRYQYCKLNAIIEPNLSFQVEVADDEDAWDDSEDESESGESSNENEHPNMEKDKEKSTEDEKNQSGNNEENQAEDQKENEKDEDEKRESKAKEVDEKTIHPENDPATSPGIAPNLSSGADSSKGAGSDRSSRNLV